MTRGSMRALFCAALMAVSMRAAANDAVPADRLQVEKKLGSVATLIDKSSAARQIEVGGTAAARERRDQARSLHARAVAAFQAGDYPRPRHCLIRLRARCSRRCVLPPQNR